MDFCRQKRLSQLVQPPYKVSAAEWGGSTRLFNWNKGLSFVVSSDSKTSIPARAILLLIRASYNACWSTTEPLTGPASAICACRSLLFSGLTMYRSCRCSYGEGYISCLNCFTLLAAKSIMEISPVSISPKATVAKVTSTSTALGTAQY